MTATETMAANVGMIYDFKQILDERNKNPNEVDM
jgi:hypothetical protein